MQKTQAKDSIHSVSPYRIYDEIIASINTSINRIAQSPIASGGKTTFAQERSKSLDLLNEYKANIFKSIHELKSLSEWDVFTIALYGETNAGKSTIIETLRIVLGEPLKRESQEKFRQLMKTIQLDANRIESLQKQIQQVTTQKLEMEQELQTLSQQQADTQASLQQALDQQQSLVLLKKSTLTFWQRISCWFKKLEEERRLAELAFQLKQIKTAHQSTTGKLMASIEAAGKQIQTCKHELDLIDKEIQELTPYQDGAIIGTGRSDFTLESQSYHFEVHGQKFSLIDVPGIEGNEKKVSTAIDGAIKKAHAVFYITRKPSPPNKGEAGRPGTIEKIRQHLSNQTEVWAIYNKGITNPMALQAPKLINAGEAESLNDLEKELRSQLGESYQGCISLSALPAYYSSSDCILPTSPHYRSQKKFLAGMSIQELQEKSNFASFVNFVSQNLSRDHKEKIGKSNRRKIHAIITDGLQMLEGMIGTFSTAKKSLDKQHKSISRELNNLEDSIERRIKSRCHDNLSQAKSNTRRLIYSDIERDISNDEFKQGLKRRMDELKDELVTPLQEAVHKEVNEFEAEIKEVVTRFLKNADEILEININRQFGMGKNSFALDFKMDNGINTLGVLSSLGGAAGLIWTAFLASNPAGWTVAVVLGAVTLLFSFVKSVWGFFSSSYKMEQQRKSADENLTTVFENIERSFEKRLSEVIADVSKAMTQIREQLAMPLHSVHETLQALQMANRDITRLAAKIE